MKTEKKLKRGLAELSPLFEQPLDQHESVFAIGLPNPAEETAPECSRFLTAGCLAQDVHLELQDQMTLLSLLGTTYPRKYLVIPASDSEDNQEVRKQLSLQQGGGPKSADEVRFFNFNGIGEIAYMPTNPPEGLNSRPVAFSDQGFQLKTSAFCLFEAKAFDMLGPSLMELLDYVLIVLPPQSQSIMKAYKMIQSMTHFNKNTRFVLFVVGEKASSLCDIIYEEFAQIVSKFLGNELNLLGWLDDSSCEINEDILQFHSKAAHLSLAKVALSRHLRLTE